MDELLTDSEISLAIQFDPEVKVGALYKELSHRAIAKAQLAKCHRDRPDREKIKELMHLGWLLGEAKMAKRISSEEFELYIDNEAELLALIEPVYEAKLERIDEMQNELHDKLAEVEMKLDDREADLINAKSEERERIAKELAGKFDLRMKPETMLSKLMDWIEQALKGEE